MHIEEAVKMAIDDINRFKAEWYSNNNTNKDEYPLELDKVNEGLWFEFICDSILSDKD